MQAYMDFMMKILRGISSIRCSFLDAFFSLVTTLGEETLFLVIALLVFWCIDKRRGYYVLITGLVGTSLNQALKLAFKIPRPWVYDSGFEPVAGSKTEATGYSFPSGHTQNIAGTFGAIAKSSKSKGVRICSIVIIALVAFSRMYLGVHTPADVLVSLAIAVALVFLLAPLFDTQERFDKFMPYVCLGSVLIALGLLLYVFLMNRDGVDADNLYSGMKNASTLFGCTLALVPVYFVDKRYIKFETGGKWYAQIIKLIGGLLAVLLIKEGLDAPLEALFGNEFLARGVRYFLIVVFAGIVWPLTFKMFSSLKIERLDNFAKKINSIFKKTHE